MLASLDDENCWGVDWSRLRPWLAELLDGTDIDLDMVADVSVSARQVTVTYYLPSWTTVGRVGAAAGHVVLPIRRDTAAAGLD